MCWPSLLGLLPSAVGAVTSLHAVAIPHSLFYITILCPSVALLLQLLSWWHATLVQSIYVSSCSRPRTVIKTLQPWVHSSDDIGGGDKPCCLPQVLALSASIVEVAVTLERQCIFGWRQTTKELVGMASFVLCSLLLGFTNNGQRVAFLV